ncbi:MAG: DUF6064 family protein [Xanthobacteraceae bacterium]
MSEWWTYTLADFLLFSPRVYYRLFELHNQALWPLQLLALAVGFVLVLLVARRPRGHGRLIAGLLAALWLFVGWSFFWTRYATINWAAAYVAPVFALEVLLLLAIGGLSDRLTFDRLGVARWVGALFVAFALAVQPMLAPLLGRPWIAAEIFGIAPDPTAIGTLGFLLLARGRLSALLFPIPVLWCVASGMTLWTMGAPEAWVSLGAAALAIAAAVWTAIARRRESSGGPSAAG